jgi:hypothetical protein
LVIDFPVTPPSSVNRSTCLPHQFRELPLDVLGLQIAYERVKRLHAERPAPLGAVGRANARPEGWTGYRIFWVLGEHIGSVDLPAHEASHLVVGRHTQCDVVLAAEPTIALRHLLLRAQVLDDGAVGLRILDLNTALAFHVDDGGPCRSIFAMGPIAVRVGPYAIIGLPIDGHGISADLPEPEIARAMSVPMRSTGGPYRNPASRAPGIFRSSHVTLLPNSALLADFGRANERPAGYGRITVDRGTRIAGIEVTEQELDAGILIGRADKCRDDGLRAVLDISISRAHVLLLRERGVVTGFDLASTQGTYVHGVRVRRAILSDSGAAVAMAKLQNVRLHWMRRV